MDLNGLRGPPHEFVQADCLAWLETQAQASRPPQYDLVFIDPPTHSRSKRMQREFDVQQDHVWLLGAASRLLAPGGSIVFSNNFQKFRLDATTLAQFDVEVAVELERRLACSVGGEEAVELNAQRLVGSEDRLRTT